MRRRYQSRCSSKTDPRSEAPAALRRSRGWRSLAGEVVHDRDEACTFPCCNRTELIVFYLGKAT
jgi:hypothetical protein